MKLEPGIVILSVEDYTDLITDHILLKQQYDDAERQCEELTEKLAKILADQIEKKIKE